MVFTSHISSQYYKTLQSNRKYLEKKMSPKSIQVLDATEELNFSNKCVKEVRLSVTKQQFCFVLLMRFLAEEQISYGSCYFLFNILVHRFNKGFIL